MYKVIVSASGGDISSVYSINSRPTSLTGDYGIMGDNGTITKTDNTYIFDETTNNYYNPCTGSTTNITDWTYDYSDRSYNLTTESGDTVTVTYGDENVTIQEGDQTYNVYYITINQGGDTHTHDWSLSDSTPPTCTAPGSNTYTCSGCGETKTETVPASGHSWQVKQTVQTKYDENGELLQSGYTIYECSVCGEQYKSTDSTGPPSVSGGGDDGGGSIWDKLGDLLGTVGGGILGLIGSLIGKLLDGLISLASLIAEKLVAVVDVVLGIFSALPGLFSGFLSFLEAAFAFIPGDAVLLLTFGIAAVVFVGIIKAVRR